MLPVSPGAEKLHKDPLFNSRRRPLGQPRPAPEKLYKRFYSLSGPWRGGAKGPYFFLSLPGGGSPSGRLHVVFDAKELTN